MVGRDGLVLLVDLHTPALGAYRMSVAWVRRDEKVKGTVHL